MTARITKLNHAALILPIHITCAELLDDALGCKECSSRMNALGRGLLIKVSFPDTMLVDPSPASFRLFVLCHHQSKCSSLKLLLALLRS